MEKLVKNLNIYFRTFIFAKLNSKANSDSAHISTWRRMSMELNYYNTKYAICEKYQNEIMHTVRK